MCISFLVDCQIVFQIYISTSSILRVLFPDIFANTWYYHLLKSFQICHFPFYGILNFI